MSTDAFVVLGTRVPRAKREEFEKAVKRRADAGETIAGPHGPKPFDLSTGLRKAIDLWLDVENGSTVDVSREEFAEVKRELERLQAANPLRATTPGSTRRRDRATSRSAAVDVAPRIGTQRATALATIAAAGATGRTADEVIAALEERARLLGERPPAVNGVARRVADLAEVLAIEPLVAVGSSEPATRKTRHGSAAIVWTITDKGLKWLEELNR